MKKLSWITGLFILTVFLIASCNDNETDMIPQGPAKLNVYLTDAPFPIDLVSQTIVTIDKVEIRKQATDTTEAEFIVLSEDSMQIDLLTLSNGITEQLASIDLEPGDYDMIRMHVEKSKVILKDNTEFDLKIPSGSSSGLKIKIDPQLSVSSGETVNVLLDFDVSKSFVAKGNWKGGNINGFNFKPVIRCVLLGEAGSIEGTVSDTASVNLENAAVKVWLPQAADQDSLITSSFSDSNGYYQIIGLLSGNYYLTAELDSFQTDTIWNVDVTQGEMTQIDFQLTPEE